MDIDHGNTHDPRKYYSYHLEFYKVTAPDGSPMLVIMVFDQRYRPGDRPLFWANATQQGMDTVAKILSSPEEAWWFYGGIDFPDIDNAKTTGEKPFGSTLPPLVPLKPEPPEEK